VLCQRLQGSEKLGSGGQGAIYFNFASDKDTVLKVSCLKSKDDIWAAAREDLFSRKLEGHHIVRNKVAPVVLKVRRSALFGTQGLPEEEEEALWCIQTLVHVKGSTLEDAIQQVSSVQSWGAS